MSIHTLAGFLYTSFAPHIIYYTILAVGSHAVHFQMTTRNKRTYEPACCIVSNNYAKCYHQITPLLQYILIISIASYYTCSICWLYY